MFDSLGGREIYLLILKIDLKHQNKIESFKELVKFSFGSVNIETQILMLVYPTPRFTDFFFFF